jgi:hypothetical protein
MNSTSSESVSKTKTTNMKQSKSSRDEKKKTYDNITHKVKMCVHYLKGSCARGSLCTFAHGESELGTRITQVLEPIEEKLVPYPYEADLHTVTKQYLTPWKLDRSYQNRRGDCKIFWDVENANFGRETPHGSLYRQDDNSISFPILYKLIKDKLIEANVIESSTRINITACHNADHGNAYSLSQTRVNELNAFSVRVLDAGKGQSSADKALIRDMRYMLNDIDNGLKVNSIVIISSDADFNNIVKDLSPTSEKLGIPIVLIQSLNAARSLQDLHLMYPNVHIFPMKWCDLKIYCRSHNKQTSNKTNMIDASIQTDENSIPSPKLPPGLPISTLQKNRFSSNRLNDFKLELDPIVFTTIQTCEWNLDAKPFIPSTC